MSSFNDESLIALTLYLCKKYLLTKQEHFQNNQ